MSIFSIDFSLAVERLLPPSLRQNLVLRWFNVLLKPIQNKHSEVFLFFREGANFPIFSATKAINPNSPYIFGDKVRYEESIYEYTSIVPSNALPQGSNITPGISSYWLLIIDSYLGVNERINYNGQTFVLEAILNKKITGQTDQRLIQINNTSDDKLPVIFYKEEELVFKYRAPLFYVDNSQDPKFPVILYKEVLYQTAFDFEVEVPIIYEPFVAKIKAEVDKYKIVGVTYTIKIIS